MTPFAVDQVAKIKKHALRSFTEMRFTRAISEPAFVKCVSEYAIGQLNPRS